MARAVTGPVAFFVAGVIDLGIYGFAAWRAHRRAR
jgi:hypothetical protein